MVNLTLNDSESLARPPVEGIMGAVGGTPLVRLRKLFGEFGIDVYAKLEMLNPAGSVKDRAAANIIKTGIDTGVIEEDTVIVESTSGNMGIGLAQACSYYGLRFIAVVDAKTTITNIAILKAYGAEVEVVDIPDLATGELLPARLARVKHVLALHPNSYWPNQYANRLNALAHHLTMREIVESLGRAPDYLFCATSTCGTIRGCAEYLQERALNTRIIAVDALGSMIFSAKKARRLIPGHGAGLRPDLLNQNLISECLHVSDIDCIQGCHELLSCEGIFAGGSTGGVISAVRRKVSEISSRSSCVLIAPDRGERYLSTIFNDEWVSSNFGSVEVAL